MKSELFVDVTPTDVSFALNEDNRLVSLQKESRNIAYAVGDIYLAKVRKLMPGLNAAFVNVGYEKDAFLHYLDLGAHFSSYFEFMGQLLGKGRKSAPPSIERMKLLPDIDKHGAITDLLQQGQELMVQIVKEPISSKGPRLTTEITFTGRFMVLIPFSDKISISQKIKSAEEKMRLRQLIESIKPKNFGVIVRTSAEGKRVAELINELNTLVECWNTTIAKAQKVTAPSLIFEEESRIVGMLRDIFSPSFEAIYVNDGDTFSQIKKYVSLIAPERAEIVKLYERDVPIFDHFGITRQIKSSFGKTVSFRSGAYIIIESTEALHVIDVNSGNRTKATNDQETNALEVNLRAADEIARQLRLRDMGGIIVVDFIDMAKGEHRQELFEHMREVMANDRARHNILPLSKFGLMQITRQRVRPALDIVTTESCPSCFGKGEVQPSLLFTDTLYEKLEYLVNTMGMKDFIMYIHPYVDAYIKRGLFWSSLYSKWRRTLGSVFKIIPDESLAYLQYRVVDANRNEVDLQNEKDMNASSAEKVNNKAAKRGSDESEEPEAKTAKTAKAPKPASTQIKSQKTDKKEDTESEKKPKVQKKPEPQKKSDEQKKSDNQATEPTKSRQKPNDAKEAEEVKTEKPAVKARKPEKTAEAELPNSGQNVISEDHASDESQAQAKKKRHRRRRPHTPHPVEDASKMPLALPAHQENKE